MGQLLMHKTSKWSESIFWNRGIRVRYPNMAQYNADVMLQIGKEAHKFILNRVKCGVISTQHMSDISSQLYPHVLGRRVESEKRLSTGTTKRFTILTSRLYQLVPQCVNLPKERGWSRQNRKDWKSLSCWARQEPKSLPSAIAFDFDTGFEESSQTDSCIKKTKEFSGFWVSNKWHWGREFSYRTFLNLGFNLSRLSILAQWRIRGFDDKKCLNCANWQQSAYINIFWDNLFWKKIITFLCQSIIFVVHFHVAYNAALD